jgi:hypothetical protein
VDNLVAYFTEGTEATRTFASFGAEIETHFVDTSGAPITAEVSQALRRRVPQDDAWDWTIDLGRQLFELRVKPRPSPREVKARIHRGLDNLYQEAASLGAYPLFEPVLTWDEPLLWVPDQSSPDAKRDSAFIRVDGARALEPLCRIASTQFTFDVAPIDAIRLGNLVLDARLNRRDYPNESFWLEYIRLACVGYSARRYGGPGYFTDIGDYARYIASHPIFIREGGVICEPPQHIRDLGDSHSELATALRNVWNYMRLRRYGNTLCWEVRPFSRRHDDKIDEDLDLLGSIVGF